MKVIYNSLIPFKGFSAINLFGIIFARKETKITSHILNHEGIHSAQMKELFFIGFYLWYLIEWTLRLFQFRFNNKMAYYAISFEKEAYDNMFTTDYLSSRKPYAFRRYL